MINIGIEFLIEMVMLELSVKDNAEKNKDDFGSIISRTQNIKHGICDDADFYVFDKLGTTSPPNCGTI